MNGSGPQVFLYVKIGPWAQKSVISVSTEVSIHVPSQNMHGYFIEFLFHYDNLTI